MRSVDMVRRDLNNSQRFLRELEDAVSILVNLGYPDSGIPEKAAQWTGVCRNRDRQRERIASLESELMGYAVR